MNNKMSATLFFIADVYRSFHYVVHHIVYAVAFYELKIRGRMGKERFKLNWCFDGCPSIGSQHGMGESPC